MNNLAHTLIYAIVVIVCLLVLVALVRAVV